MTDATIHTAAAPERRSGTSDLYRAVWRWHFYAGLIVLPFMILLAVTGALYLFKDEINDLAYGGLRRVEARDTATLPPSEIVARALAAHPGTLTGYAPPAAPDRAAQVTVEETDGLKNVVYVNAYSGTVLGAAWDGGAAGSSLMYTIRKLHSLELVGWWANRMIEIVAGFAVILVATGIYLWWPRGRNVGVAKVRRGRGRPMWRDVHAVTGIYTAAFILFLAATGLPWSGFWGDQFYKLSYAAGLGMPDGYWDNAPVSTVPVAEALERSPWVMEQQPMPASPGPNGGTRANLDAIVATVEKDGIAPGYAITVPSDATGVYTASVYPDDVRGERVIHLDQYTGKVLFDMGLADLGMLGAAAEWGVNIHMGQQFGLLNQLLLLGACVAIVVMAVSGAVIWWKRRPSRSLGVPPMPAGRRVFRGLVALLAIGGVLFPLTGATLVLMLTLDWLFMLTRQPKAA